MKLNKNGFSAKLYENFYQKNLPENFCRYFWGLSVAYFFNIIFLPFLLLGTLVEKFIFKEKISFFPRFMFGFLLIVLSSIFWSKNKDLINLSITLWSVIIILFICISIYILYINILKKVEKSKPNLLVEFVKAKYNKYCPKIDWVDNKNETTRS